MKMPVSMEINDIDEIGYSSVSVGVIPLMIMIMMMMTILLGKMS